MQFLTKRNFLHTARTTQNKNLSALLACVGTLLLPTSVLAGDLTQYQAKYDVLRKGETHGKAVRELKKAADGNYVITYHSEIEWMKRNIHVYLSRSENFSNELHHGALRHRA